MANKIEVEKASVNLLQRINVIGTSGCGKSTFSKQLAGILKLPYLEIDKIFWGPGWSFTEDELFFKKLEIELGQPCWVLDGNYTRTTPVKWKNVQTVIWLDYSLSRVMMRIMKRTFSRAISGKELWEGTGNRETFRKMFSKHSMILWSWNTYHNNRVKYTAVMNNPEYAHIRFIKLSNPTGANKFISIVKKETGFK